MKPGKLQEGVLVDFGKQAMVKLSNVLTSILGPKQLKIWEVDSYWSHQMEQYAKRYHPQNLFEKITGAACCLERQETFSGFLTHFDDNNCHRQFFDNVLIASRIVGKHRVSMIGYQKKR
jgi:hypothetical protein